MAMFTHFVNNAVKRFANRLKFIIATAVCVCMCERERERESGCGCDNVYVHIFLYKHYHHTWSSTVHVHITYANESAQWTHCTRMFANFQSVQPVKLS